MISGVKFPVVNWLLGNFEILKSLIKIAHDLYRKAIYN